MLGSVQHKRRKGTEVEVSLANKRGSGWWMAEETAVAVAHLRTVGKGVRGGCWRLQ